MNPNQTFPEDDTAARAHLRRVWQQSPDPVFDEALLAQLEAYLAASNPNDPAWHPLRDQLDASPELAAVYARLADWAQAEQADTWAMPAGSAPAPDLSFLRANLPLAQLLQERITTTAVSLRLQLDELLLGLLAPPALAMRGAGSRYGQHLLQLLPEQGTWLPFELALNAYEDAEQVSYCLVEVTVAKPGKAWPELDGTVVSLRYAGTHLTAVTDAWGTAVFADVPRTSLKLLDIEVMY